MSDQTTYTMYRKDARGVIEVDLNDPDYSLKQLIEKAQIELGDRTGKLRHHKGLVEFYEAQVEAAQETLARLQQAQVAVRQALGPGVRERESK